MAATSMTDVLAWAIRQQNLPRTVMKSVRSYLSE